MGVLLLVLVGIFGCRDDNYFSKKMVPKMQGSMLYFKDTRPSPPICFGFFSHPRLSEGYMASVPCANVENLLYWPTIEKE